ncbi:recombination regulator RecX [Bacillus spongiae]|uniref:Regulatory protein RecX n=1 Tax=Bacillus spongiae TaxID=2683610 RepID=A0ABU8HGQ7_9BACI
MRTITKITTQQKNQDRYNIFINGKYAFSVDENVLISFNLKKGLEIDELLLNEIQFEDDIQKAFHISLVYLSHRMRTEKEVVDHLSKKEIEEEVISETIHKLKHYAYLNDQEFATAFVNTQIATTDKGPKRVSQELSEKGVSPSIIAEVMSLFTKEAELDKAIVIAEKTMKKNSKLSPLQKKQKIDQTLLRKGYAPEISKAVHNQIKVEADEDENWDALYYQGVKAHKRYSTKYEGYEYVQRMKAALYRKGFSLEDIDRLLEQLKND